MKRLVVLLCVCVVMVSALPLGAGNAAGSSSMPEYEPAYGVDIRNSKLMLTRTPELKQYVGVGMYNDRHGALSAKYGMATIPEGDTVAYYVKDGYLNVISCPRYYPNIVFARYDANYNLVKTSSVAVPDMDYCGDIHVGSDGNIYFAFGRNKTETAADYMVMQVWAFDSEWNYIKMASINANTVGTGIVIPFRAGRANMVVNNGFLYLYFAKRRFDGHQDCGLISIRLSDMHVENHYQASVSHSFNQFVRREGDYLYFLNQGDANPRALRLQAYAIRPGDSSPYFVHSGWSNLFNYQGEKGDNFTGAQVTGFELGRNRNLIVGTAQPHDNAVRGVTGFGQNKKFNAYLITTAKKSASNTYAHDFKWITEYLEGEDVFIWEPRLIRINDDRFVILYTSTVDSSKYPTIHMVLINSSGDVLEKKDYPGEAFYTSSDPVIYNGKIVWLASINLHADYSTGKHQQVYDNCLMGLDLGNLAGQVNLSYNHYNNFYQSSSNSGGGNTGTATKNGWKSEGGKWYYYKNDSKSTGWLSTGGKWYYLKPATGVMQTGWQKIGSSWYYFKSGGAMQTSWLPLNYQWYYLQSSGAMKTGWLNTGGKWYYLKSSGAMATGWQQIGGKWYWFSGAGVMATGKTTIGNKTYNFSSSGAWIA